MIDLTSTNSYSKNTRLRDFFENRVSPAANSVVFDFDRNRAAHAEQGPAGAAQAPQGAELDNRGATFPPPSDGTPNRWALKHSVGRILRAKSAREGTDVVPGVCKCGTAGHATDAVTLRRTGARPSVSGVLFCDSPWLCPTCAPRMASRRAEAVDRVFDAVQRLGGQVVFVTLTVQHSKTDSLADLKKMVQDASRQARQGRDWNEFARNNGVAGVLVGAETTYSWSSGWHYHQHLGVILLNAEQKYPDPVDLDEAIIARIPDFEKMRAPDIRAAVRDLYAVDVGREIVSRYQAKIAAAGGVASSAAQDVRVCWDKSDLSRYLSKGSAAWEIASAGATKGASNPEGLEAHRISRGKNSGLTPWNLVQIADRGGKNGARATRLFEEYASVMPGTRSCVVTKTLAEKLGISLAPATEAGILSEVEADTVQVGFVQRERWHLLLRGGHVAAVLGAVSAGWSMQRIDDVISTLLDERPPPIEEADCWFVVTERQLIDAAMYRARDAKTAGGRVHVAVADYRRIAAAQSKILRLPDLRRVMEAVAA